MAWYDASDLVDVDYGCTEYAVKRLTGRDVLKETGKAAGEIGFENIDEITGGQCEIFDGDESSMRSGRLDGTMLRIHPPNQKDLHTVLLVNGRSTLPIIEDQAGRRAVPASDLLREWNAAGMRYARCFRVKK